jgi:hypothetical protein
MKFIRIGDETIRLDLITHVKEGSKEETLYGRSVRKTTDHRYGWLEVHFVSGEMLKIEGEGADVLRRILHEETRPRDASASASAPVPARKPVAREAPDHEPPTAAAAPGGGGVPAPAARHEYAPHVRDEHRSGLRNGFGR